MEKTCKQCLEVKPLNEFYEYVKDSGAYFGKCKECIKSNVNKHREDNIEKVRSYDRNRPNHSERIQKNKERLDNDPIAKKKNNEQRNEWSKQNRHKRNANQKLSRSVLKGIVIRKFVCEKCPSDIKVEAHHEDYLKPLDVVWLCSKCHHLRHKELREIERQKNI